MIKKIRLLLLPISCLVLMSCAQSSRYSMRQDRAPHHPKNISHIKNATPKHESKSRYGNPTSYVVAGRRYYVLSSAKGFKEKGIASWYGMKFHGHLTSNLEPYDMYKMTAAMPTIPLPSYVRVTNLNNGRQVIVRVNDRGPFSPHRVIDLSYAAARKLNIIRAGTAPVEVVAITPGNTASQPAHPGKIYLQVGSFTLLHNAKTLANQLKQLTQKNVFLATDKAHRLHKVRIGPLSSIQQSDQLKRQLANNGFGNVITLKR